MKFNILTHDTQSKARRARLDLPHGVVDTPVFMPVGTAATVKALTPDQLSGCDVSILLSNTYHLMLKPGEQLIAKHGGLHAFMGWDQPILTDSGGFQVFSLPQRTITDNGITFRNEHTGQPIELSPERAVQIQEALGSDIAMVLDECVPYPCDKSYVATSIERTLEWAHRCLHVHNRADQVLFGIIQGGVYHDLRKSCANRLTQMDFPGYAIGGVSVGEGLELLLDVVRYTKEFMPEDKPRYVMGIGLPEDIFACVEQGMDMFDCVIPTRYARSGSLFTYRGRIRIQKRNYYRDFYPIDPNCTCYTCRHFSRSYLHHLYKSNEILGTILGTLHNTHFYQVMMRRIQQSIEGNYFTRYKKEFFEEYRKADG